MNQPSPAPPDRYTRSAAAWADAQERMPGGVNSPVRAYTAVDRTPVTIQSGQGCRVTDLDGNTYIDYVGSYGPLILGHAPPQVVQALADTAARGTSFGMPTELETQLARRVIDAVPSIEKVRFVNSGTEACMSALRLARGATGKNKLIKCAGCYHGHTDAMLVEAGSGATTLGVPSSPGVPAATTADTLVVPYNDLDAVARTLEANPNQIAAMIVEPVAGNMGVIPPEPGYLNGLRQLCDRHGALLIFDEVMSGFRVAFGGAQARYGVTPDLTTLGKVIGGGLPCAAYGGRADLMHHIAPDGPVYQAGTLSGNPLAMAAGIATLDTLAAGHGAAYDRLETLSARLEHGLAQAAQAAGCPVALTRVGSKLGLFFVHHPGDRVVHYAQATACRTDRYTAFFGAMLDLGIMLAPSAFEAWFIATAHDDAAIDQTLTAAKPAFALAASL